MARAGFLAMTCVLLLSGCAADQAQNEACAQQAQAAPPSPRGDLPWGYYPGFGCGPIPPAQTKFS
jgi:hypothetical protein